MKKITILGILFIALILGCNNPGVQTSDNEESTKEIIDMTGRTVSVPEDVGSIVGIGPGALRLLVYIEQQDKIAGVEEVETDIKRPYIMANEDLSKLPLIGPSHGGDAELIMSQNPDVILWTYTSASDADRLQRQTGIPVIALKYGNMGSERETLFEALEIASDITNSQEKADETISYINHLIDDLNTRTKDAEKKNDVYVGGLAHRGSHGIGSTEPSYPPLEFLNTKNLASGIDDDHAFVSVEKIIDWSPGIIFIDSQGYKISQDELSKAAFSSVEAIQNEELYRLWPYNWYTTNFETLFVNSYYMGSVLYPEEFSDISIEEKADDIYKNFVGEGLYEEMKQMYGELERIEEIVSD